MKKLLIWSMMLIGIMLFSCSKEDEKPGSIYGIVTKRSSVEPLRGINVKLLKDNNTAPADWPLLLTTTTYDDGHFEFTNLEAGDYAIMIGEYFPSFDIFEIVKVESGRQSRMDIQL